MMAIGFYVLNQSGEMVGKGAFMLSPEVFCEIDTSKSKRGPFIVIPCTFKSGILGEFSLRVFSQFGAHLTECR
jgi:hypothetical protein